MKLFALSGLSRERLADLMGTVVCTVHPSMHAAFQTRSQEINVSINSIYNKLSGMETQVTRAVVRQTATELAEIIDHTGDSVL